jgi:hypothetical protein
MRFFDHYVRGVPLVDAPTDKDPPIAVESSDGKWRAESAWPPADSKKVTVNLHSGLYLDDAQNVGSGPGGGYGGIWTISPPLKYDAHFAGVPHIEADVNAEATDANFTANVYEIAPDGNAMMISRGTALVPSSGHLGFDLLGNDWMIPAGHRVAVYVSSANSEWYLPIPTLKRVQVLGGTITLPFLSYLRPDNIQGARSIKLESWLKDAPFPVSGDAIAAGSAPDFPLPPQLVPAPAVKASRKPAASTAKRLVARIAATGRKVVVYGNAPSGARLTVRLMQGTRVRATRRATARLGAYKLTFTGRRAGRYYAVVRTSVKGKALKARSGRATVKRS